MLTANQLYKNYKIEGGNMKFAEWINAQKNNGVYPINKELNSDVNDALKELDVNIDKNKYQDLYIISAIFIVAIIVNKLIKNR
jgi:prophage maintenance system killer protein